MPDQLSSDLASLKIDRSVRPKGRSPVVLVVTLLLALGAAGAAYRFGLPYLEAAVFKTEVEVTEVIMVSPAQASVELTSTGYVVAQTLSSVAAKVAGKVKALHVKQGAKVKAGDVLLEIDTADQKAAIASADSQVAAARARVMTAKANLLDVEQQTRRAQSLSESGIGPKGTAEDLIARSASLKAQVQAAEADAQAQQALASALRVNLLSYTVVAPISGTVVNKPPQVGEFIGPQPAGIAIDMGGVQIADFSTLMVETDVPEQRLSQIKMGGPCEIVMDAFPSKRYRGKAVEVTPKVNRTKATVTVKVAFVDENEGVLPDMAARVSFLSSEIDKEALKIPPKTVVPGNALADVQGGKVVYRIEGGVLRPTTVTLGPAVGSGFEVISGVSAGTKLVSNPPQGLTDGQRIKEKERAMSDGNNGSKSDIIALSKVSKTFWRGKERLDVLQELDLTMKEGSFEALMGPSGSGKSTLLNLIAGLDVPTSGSLKVAGVELSQMSEGDRAGFRAANIGFVFQTYNLLPVLTALENVELPLLLAKLPAAERRKRAHTALRVVGLEDRMDHYPRQLSGGQEQRVTIARAIVSDPKIIVADEPTGDLDRVAANDILNLLGKLNTEFNKTIVMVTHDPAAAERASICHRLDKGALAL